MRTTGRARNSDPGTSHKAAASIDVRKHHILILTALGQAGCPLSAEEIADASCVDYVAINRRLSELVELGEIERTEELHKNRSGRHAYRYRLLKASSKAA